MQYKYDPKYKHKTLKTRLCFSGTCAAGSVPQASLTVSTLPRSTTMCNCDENRAVGVLPPRARGVWYIWYIIYAHICKILQENSKHSYKLFWRSLFSIFHDWNVFIFIFASNTPTLDEAPGDGQSTWRILFELSLCVIQLLFQLLQLQFIELKFFTKSFRAPVCLVLLHFPLLIIELQLKLIKLQLIQVQLFSVHFVVVFVLIVWLLLFLLLS